MYSILIADDEKYVRQDIVNSVNWCDYGFYIIGEAGNGEEALQKIKEWHPDILITDIRMPFINGLDLIAEAVKLQPSLRTVIISGYEDFNYAQQAIRLHVVSYLTKPIDEDSVIRLLMELNQMLNEESVKCPPPQNYPSAFHKSPEISNNSPIQYFHLFCYIPFPHSGRTLEYTNNLAASWELHMNEFVRENFIDHPCQISADVISVRILLYTIQSSFIDKSIQEMISAFLMDEIQNCFCFLPTIALTPVSNNFENKTTLQTSCLQFLNTRLLYENNIIWYTPSQKQDEKFVLHITQTIEQFRTAVIERNQEDAQHYLCELMDSGNTSIYTPELLEYVIYEIANLLRRLSLVYPDNITPEIYKEVYFDYYLMGFSNILELKIDLLKRVKVIFSSIQKIKNSDIIAMIKKYVQKNYDQDISLSVIASEFFFNPSYLSYLFKQKTGGNLSSYIEEIRVKESLKLLDKGNYTICEISRMVGYNDPNYFTRIFKRHTGFTPNYYTGRRKKL